MKSRRAYAPWKIYVEIIRCRGASTAPSQMKAFCLTSKLVIYKKSTLQVNKLKIQVLVQGT